MNKFFKTILCTALCTILTVPNAFAAGEMTFEWNGDYSDNSNPKLVVTFNSPVSYVQQVTAGIYPASVSVPTYSTYTVFDETTNTDGKFTFNLTNDFNALTDGENKRGRKYKLQLQGNGYRYAESTKTDVVYVINAGDIPQLLSDFNGATAATISGYIDEVKLPLQLSGTSSSAVTGNLFSIKTADYNNSFSTLEDVRAAWSIAQILNTFATSGTTGAEIKSLLSDNAALLQVDTTDTDLAANIDDVAQDIADYANTYNNDAGIKSRTDLKRAVKQYLGVNVINKSTDETISDNFDKYKDYFDLTAEDKTAYSAMNDGDQGSVLNMAMYQKNLATPKALADAFHNAVVEVSGGGSAGGSDGSGDSSGSGNSGGSGGMGAGGGVSIGSPTPEDSSNTDNGASDTPNAGKPSFSDMGSGHWAYKYINELSAKGILNGYNDGSFKPDNNVTREEFVKIVIVATGLYDEETVCSFDDIDEADWFYQYVASAFDKGIIRGVDDALFGVGEAISRQDVAVIIARIISYLKDEALPQSEAEFADSELVSDYATESIGYLSGIGILNGYEDGSFRPQNALSRAEAATIISKLLSIL